MNPMHERILLVENDPEIRDLVGRQTLQALGYRVEMLQSAGAALQEAARSAPDLIISGLKLPGLSGKDLLAGLAAQGIDIPVILIAPKGMEADVIQAFRLGAVDFLLWPCREAEIVAAIERVLQQVRTRRERESEAQQLTQANSELQRRVRELTTLAAFGKAITATPDERAVLDKTVDGAVYMTAADCGWLLLHERSGRNFVLSAQRNLPAPASAQVGRPWDDEISALAALSGESMALHGEPLQRSKIARLGKAALVTPIKVKREVIGILAVARKAAQPFHPDQKTLLEAAADFAALAISNARRISRAEALAPAARSETSGSKNGS